MRVRARGREGRRGGEKGGLWGVRSDKVIRVPITETKTLRTKPQVPTLADRRDHMILKD